MKFKRPFFFKFLLNNSDKLSDLVAKNEEWNQKIKKKEPLEIFFDSETFTL